MNYRPYDVDSPVTYTTSIYYYWPSNQGSTLSTSVPILYTTPKTVPLKICKTYRDQYSVKYIHMHESATILKLKEEICKQLDLKMQPRDFTLTRLHDGDNTWKFIDGIADYTRIVDLNLPSYPILNVETLGESKTNVENSVPKSTSKKLTLKLYKRLRNEVDYEHIYVKSCMTLGQLKEKVRNQIGSQRIGHLYVRTLNGCTKYEDALDDMTLDALGFEQSSSITFEADDDRIPGLCGLINLGSTCFINSALQCLSNIPEFTEKILSLTDDINAPMIGAYRTLIKIMWSGEHTATKPSTLLLNISEDLPHLQRYRQHDAQEFMNHFLHLLHQELTDEKTLISDLFYGRMRSSVNCLGGCNSIETNDELFTFIPLPVENTVNLYEALYLQSNGEQQIVSVYAHATKVGTLIDAFIKQYELKTSSEQIQAVQIVNNEIFDKYIPSTVLGSTTKQDLAFIELPKKTVEQSYVECEFFNHNTFKRFRPSIFLVRPSYYCRYTDLSEQFSQIQNYICLVTGAPHSACHWSWTNTYYRRSYFNAEAIKDNHPLPFIDRINFEIDSEWAEKYIDKHNIHQASSSKSSLTNLLEDFFHEELLEGDYYCSKCSSLKAAKQKANLILPLPPVLIIQLKRFTYDPNSHAKIDTYIDFPLKDLDVAQYIVKKHKETKNPSVLYDLVAVSNHRGSLISGHYTTYARNDRNKRWYSFNDEHFREIADENDVVTKDAYILVYVQQSTK